MAYQLRDIIYMIKHSNQNLLQDISLMRLKAILFLSQIEYYTITGRKLFTNELFCYEDHIHVTGLDDELIISDDISLDDSIAYDVVDFISELLIDYTDYQTLQYLYKSKAFLKTLVSRQNRLTKQILEEYYSIYQIHSKVKKNSRSVFIDKVKVNKDFVKELKYETQMLN